MISYIIIIFVNGNHLLLLYSFRFYFLNFVFICVNFNSPSNCSRCSVKIKKKKFAVKEKKGASEELSENMTNKHEALLSLHVHLFVVI